MKVRPRMPAVTGRRKPTLAAIAERTGVSAPTVSKVINGREDVAPETRAKVLAALDAAGYRSPLQRRVTAARTTVVELVFDSMTSAYNVEILNGVLEGAGTQDAEVMISVTSTMPLPHASPEHRAQRMVDEGRAGL